MRDHSAIGFRRPTAFGASIAALVLTLVACSTTSPSPSAAEAESQAAASEAAASQAGSARCAITADASPSATVTIASLAFGDDVTVTAGQAVAFVNSDSTAHTVTEGTAGQAATDACVDEPIAAGETETVTFSEPGDYQITCKIHSSMQTVVHVQ